MTATEMDYCPECHLLRQKSGFGFAAKGRHRKACGECLARIRAQRAKHAQSLRAERRS
jgi:hypothetical protein